MAGKNTQPPAEEPVETPPEPVKAVEDTPAPAEPEAAPDAPQTAVEAAAETLYLWGESNGRPRDIGAIRDFAPADLVKAYDDAVAAEVPAEVPVEAPPSDEPTEG